MSESPSRGGSRCDVVETSHIVKAEGPVFSPKVSLSHNRVKYRFRNGVEVGVVVGSPM